MCPWAKVRFKACSVGPDIQSCSHVLVQREEMQFKYSQGMHCIQLLKLNPEAVVGILIKSITYNSSDFLFKFDIV